MEEEFYNAFATEQVIPATVAKTVNSENETGTFQKPPKLMYIEDFKGCAQQDVSLYYRGRKFETTPSPKIKTAFSADGTSGINVSTTTQSGGYSSSYSSFDPNFSTPSSQRQSSTNLQCNVTLNIQYGQNLSPDMAKQHTASLVTVLESYESLVSRRIGNPMLTKEDYDQIDSEELEFMDIKGCLASVAQQPSSSRAIEDGKKKAFLVNQDDERLLEGFSWDKYIPANSEKTAFVARILEEESVKSKPKRTKIFKSSESDEDTDDEEEYINNARKNLDSFSFNLFFADKIEMLKENRATRLKRELEELEARRIAEEKAKMEAEKAKVEENSTEKIEDEECEVKVEFDEESMTKKAEALKGREVQGLIMRDARVDQERLNSHAERLGMMNWRIHQLEEARFAPAPEPAPVPAPPEPEAEEPDEEPEEVPEEESEKDEEDPEEVPEEEPEEEDEEPEEVSDSDGDDDDGSDLRDGDVDD
ncbi:eukaryotic translation initiation factor 5B-like [Helianthus annuus]|uniref:eukaryotic translation initiation factor 5B-like n=1 Tax=Helianthus annuus TaxID=4232 RepID=UPI001653078A|nr:eukaryotic translation initiation factor 5B-like [Helianthus annuus]